LSSEEIAAAEALIFRGKLNLLAVHVSQSAWKDAQKLGLLLYEKYPTHPKLLYRLAKSLFMTKDYEQSLEYSRVALDILPTSDPDWGTF
jgi:tetratricopeptide (TPR) repeat protein